MQEAFLRWHRHRSRRGTRTRGLAASGGHAAVPRRAEIGAQEARNLCRPVVARARRSQPTTTRSMTSRCRLMLALERLSPLERAAFLLHDVFGLGFEEIAETIGRDPTAMPPARQPRPHPCACRAAPFRR